MEDLLLAARSRLALAENRETCDARVKVRATNGVVSVSYFPQHAPVANQIPAILGSVEGVREVLCTMANNSILWIQERFDTSGDAFRHLVDLAARWNAAVELLRFVPLDETATASAIEEESFPVQSLELLNGGPPSLGNHDGGIEEDDEVLTDEDESGLHETLRELFRAGCAGGGRSLKAPVKRIVTAIDPAIEYSLVVTGDLFLSKGAHVQKRLTRELDAFLADRMKCPVVLAEDLHTQYLFGKKQFLRMAGYFICTFVIFLLVFSNQIPVLRFLTNEQSAARILSVVGLLFFVPIFAHIYGTFSRLLLKCMRLE